MASIRIDETEGINRGTPPKRPKFDKKLSL
jgi:hypothetical protein